MNIPTIGGARGIFEIFVPGVFLLVNLGIVSYLFPFVDDQTREFIATCAADPVLVLIIAISFGYLTGVLLRLFRIDLPDMLSSGWLKRCHRRARKGKSKSTLWAYEEFPYILWIGEVCRLYLPAEALDFYNETWAPRARDGENKEFFDFCKVLITSEDRESANEIYAAEALTRYISGMFHALNFSFLLILATVILRYVFLGQVMIGLVIILCAYLLAIVEIVTHFRFIRLREVQTVFSASFKHRASFEEVDRRADA